MFRDGSKETGTSLTKELFIRRTGGVKLTSDSKCVCYNIVYHHDCVLLGKIKMCGET